MNNIDGIELHGPLIAAEKSFQKLAESHIANYVRGLMIQEHNLRMKSERLAMESEVAKAAAVAITERIANIRDGKWSAIEPFEMKEGQDAK